MLLNQNAFKNNYKKDAKIFFKTLKVITYFLQILMFLYGVNFIIFQFQSVIKKIILRAKFVINNNLKNENMTTQNLKDTKSTSAKSNESDSKKGSSSNSNSHAKISDKSLDKDSKQDLKKK